MKTERVKIADLIIVQFIDPMMIFEIERQAPAKFRIGIGQLANRALILNLPQWQHQYTVAQLAKEVNLSYRVLEEKIKALV